MFHSPVAQEQAMSFSGTFFVSNLTSISHDYPIFSKPEKLGQVAWFGRLGNAVVMPREWKSISTNTSSSRGSLTDRKPRRVEATAAGTKVLQKFTRVRRSQPKPITRPKIIHHLTTHTLSHHFKSPSVALPKIFRRSSGQNHDLIFAFCSRQFWCLLNHPFLARQSRSTPLSWWNRKRPFHRGCASRVFIRTRQTRWTRWRVIFSLDDQHATYY